MEDLKITDFPTYPWETLNVNQENDYSYNIRPGQHVDGDLFDSTLTKFVSYNKKSHMQILCVCDPYGPPFYARRYMYGVYSSWRKIEEFLLIPEMYETCAEMGFPPPCTSHLIFKKS